MRQISSKFEELDFPQNRVITYLPLPVIKEIIRIWEAGY